MKVGVFSTNLAFFNPIENALMSRGHEVRFWQRDRDERQQALNLGTVLGWADVLFVEFCQEPLLDVIKNNHDNKPLFARMHRIEAFNSYTVLPEFPWDQVSGLIVSAPHVGDNFMDKRGANSKPSEVIISRTNKVPDRFEEPRQNRRFDNPVTKVCQVGSFIPRKGQFELIEAFAEAVDKLGPDLKLDLVGGFDQGDGSYLNQYGDHQYYEFCKQRITDLSMEDHIRIYGFIPPEEIPGFLADEDVIVSNSQDEGTHVSVAEGLLCGCYGLCRTWRGATEVYPADVCSHYSNTTEFVAELGKFICKSPQEKAEIIYESLKVAVPTYTDTSTYGNIVEILENSL